MARKQVEMANIAHTELFTSSEGDSLLLDDMSRAQVQVRKVKDSWEQSARPKVLEYSTHVHREMEDEP